VFATMFQRSAATPSGVHGTAGGEASIHGGGAGGFKAIEAKYPALLFKQQLDAFVQKVFPLLRDNVKKAVTPLLASCIMTPKGTTRRAQAAAGASEQVVSKAWGDILVVFDKTLVTVKDAHVPGALVCALFKQLFSFVNVNLFNQLLLRRECCSFSNGEHVRTGLSQVESWIAGAGKALVGDSWDELRFIRNAVQFLVIGSKPRRTLDEIESDICPELSIQQLYRISTMYWDDRCVCACPLHQHATPCSPTHRFVSCTLTVSTTTDLAVSTCCPVPRQVQHGDGVWRRACPNEDQDVRGEQRKQPLIPAGRRCDAAVPGVRGAHEHGRPRPQHRHPRAGSTQGRRRLRVPREGAEDGGDGGIGRAR
jgi:hypothetical protein